MGVVSPQLYGDHMLLFRVIQSTEDFGHVQGGINNIGHWVEGNYYCSKCNDIKMQK